MVTEVIDSCSQAGGVPQAMGDHGRRRLTFPVDQVLQAQVVQKTVEIQLIDRASREPPSVFTQEQIMIVATPRLLGDSETAPFILKIQETLEILVVQRQVSVQRKNPEDC